MSESSRTVRRSFYGVMGDFDAEDMAKPIPVRVMQADFERGLLGNLILVPATATTIGEFSLPGYEATNLDTVRAHVQPYVTAEAPLLDPGSVTVEERDVTEVLAEMVINLEGLTSLIAVLLWKLQSVGFPRPLFPLGSVRQTVGAHELLERTQAAAEELLFRHVIGDFGNLDAEDLAHNRAAVKGGTRILSSYWLLQNNDLRIWIITEADRSGTTLLLPEEY
jgi:hypothetical protein